MKEEDIRMDTVEEVLVHCNNETNGESVEMKD